MATDDDHYTSSIKIKSENGHHGKRWPGWISRIYLNGSTL